jgi:hypothetical protein
MAIHLQSIEDPTLYFNGSTTDNRGIVIALFDPITNARNFISEAEAQEVADYINVPVKIITL